MLHIFQKLPIVYWNMNLNSINYLKLKLSKSMSNLFLIFGKFDSSLVSFLNLFMLSKL